MELSPPGCRGIPKNGTRDWSRFLPCSSPVHECSWRQRNIRCKNLKLEVIPSFFLVKTWIYESLNSLAAIWHIVTLYDLKWNKSNDTPTKSAEKRIEMMMGLYNYFRGMLTIPRFPLYGGKITCRAKDCGKDTSLCKRFCGMNFNLVEEILAGVQARVCLYLMTPSTGRCINSYEFCNAFCITFL